MKRILVISGGAIKGYIQAQWLKKKEAEIGFPLYQHYDLIAGSSVGAINGALIVSGKLPMDRIESIYPDMVKQIFKKSWFPFAVPMFDRKNFIKVVCDEVGMIKMKECKTKLQVTAVNICDKRNHFFKSWDPDDAEKFLWTQVCKSFAAPLFFGSIADENTKSVWFDGGLAGQNLPLEIAIFEALSSWPNEDEYFFDILGAGFVDDTISFEKAKSFRAVRQALQFFNLSEGGLANDVSLNDSIGMIQYLSKYNPKFKFNYWDIKIDKKYDKFDGVEFLDQYKKYGIEMSKAPLIVG